MKHPVIYGPLVGSPYEAGDRHDQKRQDQKKLKAPFFSPFSHHLNVCSQYANDSQKQSESAHYGDKSEKVLAEVLQVTLRDKEGDHHDESG